nr:hypothetical protein [Mucilaginibacter sp. E4BP6]
MNDSLTKILLGVSCLALGIVVFLFIQNETRKKKDTNTYDFNVYVFSVVSIIAGLFFIYKGIFN